MGLAFCVACVKNILSVVTTKYLTHAKMSTSAVVPVGAYSSPTEKIQQLLAWIQPARQAYNDILQNPGDRASYTPNTTLTQADGLAGRYVARSDLDAQPGTYYKIYLDLLSIYSAPDLAAKQSAAVSALTETTKLLTDDLKELLKAISDAAAGGGGGGPRLDRTGGGGRGGVLRTSSKFHHTSDSDSEDGVFY